MHKQAEVQSPTAVANTNLSKANGLETNTSEEIYNRFC